MDSTIMCFEMFILLICNLEALTPDEYMVGAHCIIVPGNCRRPIVSYCTRQWVNLTSPPSLPLLPSLPLILPFFCRSSLFLHPSSLIPFHLFCSFTSGLLFISTNTSPFPTYSLTHKQGQSMDKLKLLSKRDFFRSKPKQRQQGVRGVYKDGSSSIASATTTTPAPQPDPVYFNYQADPASGKNVVPRSAAYSPRVDYHSF